MFFGLQICFLLVNAVQSESEAHHCKPTGNTDFDHSFLGFVIRSDFEISALNSSKLVLLICPTDIGGLVDFGCLWDVMLLVRFWNI